MLPAPLGTPRARCSQPSLLHGSLPRLKKAPSSSRSALNRGSSSPGRRQGTHGCRDYGKPVVKEPNARDESRRRQRPRRGAGRPPLGSQDAGHCFPGLASLLSKQRMSKSLFLLRGAGQDMPGMRMLRGWTGAAREPPQALCPRAGPWSSSSIFSSPEDFSFAVSTGQCSAVS